MRAMKGPGLNRVLVRTSNPSASDFQDSKVSIAVHLEGVAPKQEPLYIVVAKKVIEWDKKYSNCLMVVGSTWPKQLAEIRMLTDKMFFLIPGIGAQDGDLRNTLKYGLNKDHSGLIISTSRSIIFASKESDFTQAAKKEALELRDEINKYR